MQAGGERVIGRITILGGSSVYVPEFIHSLISHNLLPREVVLYGRHGEKLEIVAGFCERLIEKAGFPTVVIPSTNLEESVAGAKYVLNHVRVGGMKARVRDEKLPPSMGMIGDESLGAGGISNALRTLPVALDFASRIETVNPDCTFINLTNPMGTVVEAITKKTNLKTIGICDLPGAYVQKVARLLGIAEEDLFVDFIGLNHMGWIQNVRHGKKNIMYKVLDTIHNQRPDDFDYDLIELFRMIPTRTVSLYFHADRILKAQKNTTLFRGEVLHEAEKHILKAYADPHLNEIPSLTRERNTPWYEQTLIPLIQALESRKKHSRILCVRNDGAIRDLPEDCSVEVPTEVSNRMLAPRHVGDCPHFLKGLFLTVKESDRWIIEAVLHKSYEYALQALTINPLVPSLETARRYLDKIIETEEIELH